MKKDFIIKYILLIFLMTFTSFVAFKVVAKNIEEDTVTKEDGIARIQSNKLNNKVNINYNDNVELQKYYNENNLDKKLVDLSNCLHSYISEDTLSENIKNDINELENYYNNDDANFAFYYLDLNTGFNLAYNEEQPIFGASSIKAPFIIYIYKQASLNNINLDEELTYTSEFYSGGSGILKNEKPGKNYSVRQLCYLTITESDNIAYKILANRFGINNAKEFWNSLNVNSIYTNNVLFSDITAKDSGAIMKYLYDFSMEDDIYGKEVMNVFTEALYNFIPKDGLVMAHKSGWASTSIHDLAIKFDENPYILVVLSKRGEIEYQSLFDYTSQKISNIHKNFWDTNLNYCIEQFKN